MAVYVCIHAIESLEELTDQDRKGLWKGHTWRLGLSAFIKGASEVARTYSAGKH